MSLLHCIYFDYFFLFQFKVIGRMSGAAEAFRFFGSLGSEVYGPAQVEKFHWADYLIFSLSLAISLVIGIFFAFTGDRQRSTQEFLLAGRSAGIIPVAMSALASFISAVFIVNVPGEVMYNGTMFSMQFIGYILFTAIGTHTFLPFFHKRGQISAYQVRLK